MGTLPAAAGVQISGRAGPRYDEILTARALELLGDLERRFGPRRTELLGRRAERQLAFDRGALPDFLEETKDVRAAAWSVAPAAPGLVDRRVEITGPTDKKMTVNALNSGASVWLADFEDATTPTWSNMVEGQINLLDALNRTIDFTTPEGRTYELHDSIATIVARPRGWHLVESHVRVDGEPVSASLFDFTMHLCAAGLRQAELGLGAYYYLPKLESHLEARLWEDVFTAAEEALGLRTGTIRATVLIETLPAAFEMDEILFELRSHASGLNAGRWDYLFSMIKKLRNLGGDYVLPDRNSVTMAAPLMRAYAELLVRTCHARGAHAIGGMAAFIPSRHKPEVNARALAKVREDKEREAAMGFDGSWVAHPDLVGVCREVFDAVLGDRPNQVVRRRDEVQVRAADLLDVASAGSTRSMEGLRNDVSVALQYLAAWLAGTGAVAIFDLMEDAATAEIARSQVWQWLANGVVLDSGETVTTDLVRDVIADEVARLEAGTEPGSASLRYDRARALFEQLVLGEQFAEFLTLSAYDALT
jgi:malate synthase